MGLSGFVKSFQGPKARGQLHANNFPTQAETRLEWATRRNLSQRADHPENTAAGVSQRLSKLEGAEAERNRRPEGALKKFDPLLDEISKQINEDDDSNVLFLVKVKKSHLRAL